MGPFFGSPSEREMFKKGKKKKIEKNLFEMDFRWAADFDFSSVLTKKTLKIVKKMKKVAKKAIVT